MKCLGLSFWDLAVFSIWLYLAWANALGMMSEILIWLLAWKGRSGVEWDKPRIKYYNVHIYQFVTHNGNSTYQLSLQL